MSIVIVTPLNTEFIQIFFSISLKLNGHPFFNTSIEFLPSNSITALECDKSVTAKSLSLKSFLIFFKISFFFETNNQLLGPAHKKRKF